MIDIKVIIGRLGMPAAKAKSMHRPSKKKCQLVEEWIKAIESDKESSEEWERLKSLYNKLSKKKKLSPDNDRLLKKMSPTIKKFAQLDSENPAELTTEHLSEG